MLLHSISPPLPLHISVNLQIPCSYFPSQSSSHSITEAKGTSYHHFSRVPVGCLAVHYWPSSFASRVVLMLPSMNTFAPTHIGKEQGHLTYGSPWCHKESDGTWWLNNNNTYSHTESSEKQLLQIQPGHKMSCWSPKRSTKLLILPDLIFFTSSRTEVVTDGFQKGLWYFYWNLRHGGLSNDCPQRAMRKAVLSLKLKASLYPRKDFLQL